MKSRISRVFLSLAVLVCGIIGFSSCSEEEAPANTLSVNPGTVSVAPNGGSYRITISTNAGSWSISNQADWIAVSETSGTTTPANVTITVSSRSLTLRSATLVISAGSAKPTEVVVTQAAASQLYALASESTSLAFNKPGGSAKVKIITDAPQWHISTDARWVELSVPSGTSGTNEITVTVAENDTDAAREATILLTAEGADNVEIKVSQKGPLYPNYNTSPATPDMTGMASTASEIASKIILGWNLGNSLEATGGETAWGNPKVTKAFIDGIKQRGFNAVRLPCAWNQYLENAATAQIKNSWFDRVKEVVQYCVDNDIYVLLNVHWDGGWLENNVTPEKQDENNAKQKAFWQQIATQFRDFDERLLFASANEPNVETAQQMTVLNSYHQTFIDAVRSTGGRNRYRVLVIQGPSTDIDKTNELMTALPTDPVDNRMMVEVHYYSPWNFAGLEQDADWGKMFYYWGQGFHSATDPTRNSTWGEEAYVDAQFLKMKTQFVDKGIPVLLGEFSPIRRTTLTGDNLALHLDSRAYYIQYVTRKAKENGLIPFYWDNGSTGNLGSGIFNRNTGAVADQKALDALIDGAQ